MVARKLSAPFALLIALSGLVGCAGNDASQRGLPSEAAAKVGETIILERHLAQKLDLTYRVETGKGAAAFGPPRYQACLAAHRAAGDDNSRRYILRGCKVELGVKRAQVLASLIEAEWLEREARRQGIDDSDRRARRLLARAQALRDQLPTATQAPSGRAKVEALRNARMSVQRESLLKAIPVTSEQIAEYGKANVDVFGNLERRRIQVIQLASARRAGQARKAIARGKSWRQISARYGVRDTRGTPWTGTRTLTKRTTGSDRFTKAVFRAKPNQLAGPVKNFNGWFVFEVKAIRPGSPHLTAEARKTITGTLRAESLKRTLRARYGPITDCAPKYEIPEALYCL